MIEDIKTIGTRGYRVINPSKPTGKIVCADGFTMSVQAGPGYYCTPKPGFSGTPLGYDGPYTAAEVGFPSEKPDPWAKWSDHAETPEEPTGTVYGCVSFETIEALIALHGGEA